MTKSEQRLATLFSGVQSIASVGTLLLVCWGVFFSPLSEVREAEYKREILIGKDSVELLKNEKKSIEIDLQRLKRDVNDVENLKKRNLVYLDNLYKIVINAFLEKINSKIEEINIQYQYQKHLKNIVDNINEEKIDKEKLAILGSRRALCSSYNCLDEVDIEVALVKKNQNDRINNSSDVEVDMMLRAMADNISKEQQIKNIIESINLKESERPEYDLYSVLTMALDDDEFGLLLPKDRVFLIKKIKNFMKNNKKILSLPLLIKLTQKWEIDSLKKESDIVDQNYQKVFTILSELKNYLTDSKVVLEID